MRYFNKQTPSFLYVMLHVIQQYYNHQHNYNSLNIEFMKRKTKNLNLISTCILTVSLVLFYAPPRALGFSVFASFCFFIGLLVCMSVPIQVTVFGQSSF